MSKNGWTLAVRMVGGRRDDDKSSIYKLNNAKDALSKPGSAMIQTNYHGRPSFWMSPSGGRVDPDVAKKLSTIHKSSSAGTRCFQTTIKRGGCVRVTTRRRREHVQRHQHQSKPAALRLVHKCNRSGGR
jgi:hypothetical protein